MRRPPQGHLHPDSTLPKEGNTKWIQGRKARGWRNANKKPVKNIDLWQRLEAAVESHEIRWTWVRGHTGHPENERADELARNAIPQR